MWPLLLLAFSSFASVAGEEKEQKLSWKDEDGLEVKIVRPVKDEKCLRKSQEGDVLYQWYKLTDKDGKEVGSNFNKDPYVFKLGSGQVIKGMERAMTGMCIGEKRKVVIPPAIGFGADGNSKNKIDGDQTLYYTVQLVDIFRAVPGDKWVTDDGITIEVTHQIEPEKCKKSAPGDKIHQQYTLHLEGGKYVDSSSERDAPFIFTLQKGEVIAGIDIAMTGMCEGEKRKVIIPPELGYGEKGSPPTVPPNAVLFFDIFLEKLEKKSKDEL